MRNSLYFIFIALLILSCESDKVASPPEISSRGEFNITEELVSTMNWMNQPDSFAIRNNSLQITANNGTDFFNNPEDDAVAASAPFLYEEVSGDFVATAWIQPDFSSQWNAVALMVHFDSVHWIKFAFENSDATGPSIVSVVTKGTSDDANGVPLNADSAVWLAIARKGNIFSIHWSVDGENYKMTRLTAMPNQEVVKIGVEAQSPVGERAIHQIHYFEIKATTVENLRNIN